MLLASKQLRVAAALGTATLLATAGAVAFAPQALATPQGTPIKTVEDFAKISANPSGTYYLANNIDFKGSSITVCNSYQGRFTGTFNGNGKTISNYAISNSSLPALGDAKLALFGYAENASFQNLTFKNFSATLTIKDDRVIQLASLLASSYGNCSISNVSTSGSIKITSTGSSYITASGLAASCYGTLQNCSSTISLNASLSTAGEGTLNYGGVLGQGGAASGSKGYAIKNCSSKGTVTVNASGYSINICGLACGTYNPTSLSGCTNASKISVSAKPARGSSELETLSVSGLCANVDKLTACGNTGAIKVTSTVPEVFENNIVGGVGLRVNNVSKCFNKGAVTYSGKQCGEGVGGIVFSAGTMTESYNTGAVKVTGGGNLHVGGLAGDISARMSNCYNIGAVTLSGGKHAGGLVGDAGVSTVSSCYSTGAVTAKKNASRYSGQIAGWYEVINKRTISNVYYTKSGKAFGEVGVTASGLVGKATKVGGISSGSCPKLSSKYWTYSSKAKRLVLKANKE
ncbi:MAG: hypothetical protein ACI36W_04455 [Coriobacteriales bacterium]